MRGGSSKTRIETISDKIPRDVTAGMRGGSSKTRIETLLAYFSMSRAEFRMRGGSSKTRIETGRVN